MAVTVISRRRDREGRDCAAEIVVKSGGTSITRHVHREGALFVWPCTVKDARKQAELPCGREYYCLDGAEPHLVRSDPTR